MNDKLPDEKNEVIIKALNKAIENKAWEQSNFLRMLRKKLTQLRDDFLKKIGAVNLAQQQKTQQAAAAAIARKEQQEVFVSLYSSQGNNLQSWEKIIQNLPKQLISRPIYAQEEKVKAILKTKENKQNEAYLAVYIDKASILNLAAEKAGVDKLGTVLLTIKDNSLRLDQVSRFMHMGILYHYENARLIRV